eukprot:scaffold290299_cov18-Tisochrysis_lutea.AAC.1
MGDFDEGLARGLPSPTLASLAMGHGSHPKASVCLATMDGGGGVSSRAGPTNAGPWECGSRPALTRGLSWIDEWPAPAEGRGWG